MKISTVVLWGSLLPLGLVLDWGPKNDKCQAQALIAKASQATLPAKLTPLPVRMPNGFMINADWNGEWKA